MAGGNLFVLFVILVQSCVLHRPRQLGMYTRGTPPPWSHNCGAATDFQQQLIRGNPLYMS